MFLKSLLHSTPVHSNLGNGQIMFIPIMTEKFEFEVPGPILGATCRWVVVSRFRSGSGGHEIKHLLLSSRTGGLGRIMSQIHPMRHGLGSPNLKLLNMTGISFVIGQNDLFDQNFFRQGQNQNFGNIGVQCGGDHGITIIVRRQQIRGSTPTRTLFNHLGASRFASIIHDQYFGLFVILFLWWRRLWLGIIHRWTILRSSSCYFFFFFFYYFFL
mmetsp:Transcript_20110/g.42084  ORF Transcript_20110/g.42084 Transcript_20110/m.42084 type:complete len:214 (+) Transcript_20110:1548-2189(+)